MASDRPSHKDRHIVNECSTIAFRFHWFKRNSKRNCTKIDKAKACPSFSVTKGKCSQTGDSSSSHKHKSKTGLLYSWQLFCLEDAARETGYNTLMVEWARILPLSEEIKGKVWVEMTARENV